jgi:signal transduction histidine kinase
LRDQVDRLLDLSKFDAGAVQPDVAPFDLALLVRKLVEELRPEADARKLTLVAAVDTASVRSDAGLIERVLRNLLANAVKYTSAGTVTVRAQRQAGEVVVEVSDTGPGIPGRPRRTLRRICPRVVRRNSCADTENNVAI